MSVVPQPGEGLHALLFLLNHKTSGLANGCLLGGQGLRNLHLLTVASCLCSAVGLGKPRWRQIYSLPTATVRS